MTPLLNPQGKPYYVLRRISDKFVINMRALSNTLTTPNPGPDQQYLPVLIDETPNNDSQLTVVTVVEAIDEVALVDNITHVVSDRPLDDQILAATNAKRLQFQKIAPPTDLSEAFTIILAALVRKQAGLGLTAFEQANLDMITNAASIVTDNAANYGDILTSIKAGQKPDVTGGYAVVTTPVVVPLDPTALPATPAGPSLGAKKT